MIDKLRQRFGARILDASSLRGEQTIILSREHLLEVMGALRGEPEFSFDLLVDLTAVDWPERKPRFEVVYHLGSVRLRRRLRVKVGIEADDAVVPSLVNVWKAADWLERECFDMFGIRFDGHPDLRRILMYDSFEGHPLRKDYPVNKRQPIVPETDPVIHPLRPSR